MTKTVFIVLIFVLSLNIFAQTRELKTFEFQGKDITYSRIDYSKFGIAHFFITTYSMDASLDGLEQSAYNCMLKKDRLYHTLYFFIRIPDDIEEKEIKSLLFKEFVNHIKKEEQIQTVNLYLNFETDYSQLYQSVQEQMDKNDVKRVIQNIKGNFNCKHLGIK